MTFVVPDGPGPLPSELEHLGAELGAMCTEKERAYGRTVHAVTEIVGVLYPDGIRPDQYDDVLLVARIADKLCRIASRGPAGADLGGESPYDDIVGYGLLGARKERQRR